MKTLLRALPVYWRTSIATMLAYRAGVALWAIWGIVYPAVAMAMWSAAQRSSGKSDIGGYSQSDFVAYFLVMMVVSHVCTAWDVFEMGWLVRSGRMSPLLMRPILPLWSSAADNAAYKAVSLVILVPIWIVIGLIFKPNFQTSGWQVIVGVISLLIAAVMNYVWGYNVSLIAFWTHKTEGIGELYFGGSLLFGGRFSPLEVLPPSLMIAASFLPFKWITWFPTTVLTGRATPAEAAIGFLWQIGWLIVGIVVFRIVWRAAVKNYSAVGA
jgi:ABC-2 type transport system permease protein